MSWSADVPFPAEDMSKCRGCDRPIGWIRWTDENNVERPHPVEVKGWHGEPCPHGAAGSKKGFTLDGERLSVREGQPGLFAPGWIVVFESHFGKCPKAADFRRGTQNGSGQR